MSTSTAAPNSTNGRRRTEIFAEPAHALKGDIVELSLKEGRGRNVSGRSWKARTHKPTRTLVLTKKNNQAKSWERRQADRLAKKEAKELQDELREERRQAKILKKERRLENERRRQENEFKNAQKSAKTLNLHKVGATMKAMSKKQLRQIKKTRLNPTTGVVEYVPAYAK